MLQRFLRKLGPSFRSESSLSDDGLEGDIEAGFTSRKRQRRGRHPVARMIQFLRVRLKHHYRLHTGVVFCCAILLAVCFVSLLVGSRRYMRVRVRGPAALSALQVYPHERLQNLVMVAGHAVYTGTHCEEADGENSWFLEAYQKHPGQASTFVTHIRAGVEIASGDPSALLLFSGGETRKSAGPRSEAQSYWSVAESKDWFGAREDVRGRALTEEHARDSYENLLFSICRFKELTGQYPENITVVSYAFKQERFVDLHRKAIRFPSSHFFYVGTPAAPSSATEAAQGIGYPHPAVMAKAAYAEVSSKDGGMARRSPLNCGGWVALFPGGPSLEDLISMPKAQGSALCLLVSFALIVPLVQGLATQFSFSEFAEQSTDLTCLGDAAIVNGMMELTVAASDSTGRVLYSRPLQILDPLSNKTSSFSTVFSFAMLFPPSASIIREGLAFHFVPDNKDLGDSGSQLGIYNTTNTATSSHTIAVILETSTTESGNDNHVGVSVTNATSAYSVDLGDQAISFRNGSVVVTWIDYDSGTHKLDVTLGSDATQRPIEATLSCNIELSSVFKPYMYVGFSASNIGSGSGPRHVVYAWDFQSSGIEVHGSASRSILRKSFIAGFTILIIVTLLACSSVFWLRQKRRAIAQFRRAEQYEHEVMLGPRKFSYKEVSVATGSFNDKEKLGSFGEGTMYRGVLPDSGYLVAVKRITHGFGQGGGDILAHLDVLGQLRHRHLVQLHGCCYENGEVLLVYEFMPNGSLDKVLFDRKGDLLSWSNRFQIICGVAGALEYLQQGWEEVVLHRNIKPSNVMLDNNFCPKLGDYGIAQLIHCHNRRENTVVAGTVGYVASEVVQTGKASEKSDVFSFGALTLEVACGRRALETSLSAEKSVLIEWVWGLHLQGRLHEAADPRLKGGYDLGEMTLLLELGLHCTRPNPGDRPSMSQIVDGLSGKVPMPKLPSAGEATGRICGPASLISGLTIEELMTEEVAQWSPDIVMNISPTRSYGHKSVEIFENVGV